MKQNNLLIWGTAEIAKRFEHNLQIIDGISKIVGFVETKPTIAFFHGIPVYSPNNLPKNWDYIIICSSYANKIAETCKQVNIDLNQCIFMMPGKQNLGCKSKKIIKEICGEKNWTDFCANYNIMTDTFVLEDAKKYIELNSRPTLSIHEDDNWYIISDKYGLAGSIHNYFWQDLWAANLIYKRGVKKHFDIGSRIDGFIAHLLAMEINVTIIDIREFPEEVKNLSTIVDDATYLSKFDDNSISSLSALCSLEHFGLGRYGDPIDPEACFKCFSNIQRVLKKGGYAYISVPIGKERVEFNAHRVFYAKTIVEAFSELNLVSFACTRDGKIEHNIDINKYDDDINRNHVVGLFEFQKN